MKTLASFPLKKLKLEYPQTLFELSAKDIHRALSNGRCPFDGTILYGLKDNPDLFKCRSKKHKRPFIVNFSTLQKYVNKHPLHENSVR